MHRMRSRDFAAVVAGIVLLPLAAPAPGLAQTQTPEPLQVGDVAPEFTVPGATRYGVLAEPVSLSDYQGKTVVLSFFFRARTKG